jgi:hypothetical protein
MQFYKQCNLREVGTHTRQVVYLPEELAKLQGLVEVKADKTTWQVVSVGDLRVPEDQLMNKIRYNKDFGGSIK